MTTTTTTFSMFAPDVELKADTPYEQMMSRIANVYADSMRANTEQLWMSSVRIIQEHTMRAFIQASQSCMEALAKNAAAVQQQSVDRMTAANQKAFEIMSQGFNEAMAAGMKPAR
jgi:hypothetical protein